jgi:hypothetical protein
MLQLQTAGSNVVRPPLKQSNNVPTLVKYWSNTDQFSTAGSTVVRPPLNQRSNGLPLFSACDCGGLCDRCFFAVQVATVLPRPSHCSMPYQHAAAAAAAGLRDGGSRFGRIAPSLPPAHPAAAAAAPSGSPLSAALAIRRRSLRIPPSPRRRRSAAARRTSAASRPHGPLCAPRTAAAAIPDSAAVAPHWSNTGQTLVKRRYPTHHRRSFRIPPSSRRRHGPSRAHGLHLAVSSRPHRGTHPATKPLPAGRGSGT